VATGGNQPIVLKKSAMVSAADKHASEIEVFTCERGCLTQISCGSVLKRRFHRSLSSLFQKADFFNTIGQEPTLSVYEFRGDSLLNIRSSFAIVT